MSDKVKPFTPEQRVIHEKHFQVYEACGSTKPVPKAYHIKVMRRYEATLRQIEEGLAAVTAERDAYKAFVDAWLCDRDPAVAAQVYMEWRAVNGPGGNERWVAAVEALREIADLEDKLQPSGNSGGFAAAAGILAGTWDGEKPEDTIRRMRDGTPPPETTKPIAETRMGEPNAIDAEEET